MKNECYVLIFAATCLTACQPSVPSDAGVQPTASAPASPPAPTVIENTKRQEASPLLNLLETFVSDEGKQWTAYNAVPQVTWLGLPPIEYADGRYSQKGQLLLVGFGSNKIPNGKEGAEYKTIDGNEGQSGVTLDGDAKQVQSVSVKKFYFTEEFEQALRQQFDSSVTVKSIAHGCAPDEDAEIAGKNMFFEISLPHGSTVYAEVFLEAGGKYSPGYTVFDFNRTSLDARIKELGCLAS